MKDSPSTNPSLVLIAGDILVIAVVSVIGFEMHETLGSGIGRFAATFVPFTGSWLAVGWTLKAFNLRRVGSPTGLWLAFWGMILAAPLGGVLRGLWLNAPVIPLFIVVFGGLCALALPAWRFLLSLWINAGLRKKPVHG